MAVCDDIGGSDSVPPPCGNDQIGRACGMPSAVVEGGQALGLVLELAAGRPVQRLERLQPDPPSSWRQVPATAPSTRKVGNEWGP